MTEGTTRPPVHGATGTPHERDKAASAYVECEECGHAIEAHDGQGCCSVGGECPCPVGFTEREIRRLRHEAGLPRSYDRWDVS